MKIKFKKISIICVFFLTFGMLGCSNKNVEIMKSEEYNKGGTLKAPRKPEEPKQVADVKPVNELKGVVTPNKVKEPKQVKKPKEVQVEKEMVSSVLPSEAIEYNPVLNEPVESSHALNEAVEPIENKVEPNSSVMMEH